MLQCSVISFTDIFVSGFLVRRCLIASANAFFGNVVIRHYGSPDSNAFVGYCIYYKCYVETCQTLLSNVTVKL